LFSRRKAYFFSLPGLHRNETTGFGRLISVIPFLRILLRLLITTELSLGATRVRATRVRAAHVRAAHYEPARQERRYRSRFIPAGAGRSFSLKLPALRRFRPLPWFGLNFMGGHRYVLDHSFPDDQIGNNGFFYSVSPAFFLDRFTADVKPWQRRRFARK